MGTEQFAFSFPFTLGDRLRVAFLLPPQSRSGLIAWSIWPLIALCNLIYFVSNQWRLDAGFWLFTAFCLAFTPILTVITVLVAYAQKRTREPFTVTFDGSGIHTVANTYEFTHRWPAISRVTCSGGFLFFFFSHNCAHCLPLSVVRRAGVLQPLLELARSSGVPKVCSVVD